MSDNRNGFIVVSGCPRSGTSVCMDIQRAAHGEDSIVGNKFPQENREERKKTLLEKREGESDRDYGVRSYVLEKSIKHEEETRSEEDKYKDMNPEGFWEMAFSVRGIIYSPQFRPLLKSLLDGEKKICKVVSQGLLMSDPIYISKVIFMIRHPRAVAKSQERLTRGFNYVAEDGSVKNSFENFTVHSPDMFIEVTQHAARFFLSNPEIPVRFYHFEDLVSEPLKVIDDMQSFLPSGNYSEAKDIVQPKLNRSKHEDIENKLWQDAEFVYDKFCQAAEIINSGGDRENANILFEEILYYFEDPERMFNRDRNHWFCFRAQREVNEDMCKQCIGNIITMENFKSESERRNVPACNHWSEEPCLYECKFDFDRDELLTIEESIDNNFWKSGAPLYKELSTITESKDGGE